MASVQKQSGPWLDPVVTKGELDSTSWIKANTPPTAHFEADIFGGELIMGMTTRIPIVGGDWSNAPDPICKYECLAADLPNAHRERGLRFMQTIQLELCFRSAQQTSFLRIWLDIG